MVSFERIEPLPHIIIQREPQQAEIRPRRYPGNRIQPRSNRRQHAERMKEQTTVSAAELARIRASLGVAADRFLVLRLETLDVNQREALERLDISVVEELEEKRDGRTIHRLLIQFADEESLATFTAEYDRYAEETDTHTALPHGKRRDLFDALESVSLVTSEERTGRRLRREGRPARELFYLDVDLWNPGTDDGYQGVLTSFREVVQSCGGSIVKDPLMIPSLILVKVEATLRLLEALLQLDLVSLVDLPPMPPPEDSFDILAQIQVPELLPQVPEPEALACVVDSGVLAGHPLLRGVVVAEEDFDSGEATSVDLNGHGTQVGGLVVYGNIARRMQGNEWLPQVSLYSAKVLRNEPNPVESAAGNAAFAEKERVEEQLKRAIEYFHREYNCRVFNLSVGHRDRLYTGGRQLPWAELLDNLARTLDIVIVVSAGNVHDPDIPAATNSPQFQQHVAQSLQQSKHRLIDPATAALCLTVGSVARREDPYIGPLGTQLAASAEGCPSPFTRCGPGVAGAVKPELVAPGGNLAVDSIAGTPRWRRNDPNLGEPTLNRNFDSGGPLRAVCGTSFAAAQVTHIAARIESALRKQLDAAPSQNLVRALLVSSAHSNDRVKEFIDSKDLLNTIGYGQPNIEYCWSSNNRVSLVTEDAVGYRTFHVYSLVVPKDFLLEPGRRSISISLAYDPPTRLSRREYIATAMWLEIFGGLTTEQVIEYRPKYEGDGEPPKVPDRNKLNFKPAARTITTSTVQKRAWNSNQGTVFLKRPDPNGDPSLHIFVGCRTRFPNPLGEDSQRYALVITIEHDRQHVDVYQEVRARVKTRARIRVTG